MLRIQELDLRRMNLMHGHQRPHRISAALQRTRAPRVNFWVSSAPPGAPAISIFASAVKSDLRAVHCFDRSGSNSGPSLLDILDVIELIDGSRRHDFR